MSKCAEADYTRLTTIVLFPLNAVPKCSAKQHSPSSTGLHLAHPVKFLSPPITRHLRVLDALIKICKILWAIEGEYRAAGLRGMFSEALEQSAYTLDGNKQ